MTKKIILVLGSFGWKNNRLSGQTVKTRNVLKLLQEKAQNGNFQVDFFDTSDIKHNRISLIKMFRKLFNSDIIIYLPAQNSLKFAFPVIFILSQIFNFSIIYIVVGGWLADFLTNKPIHVFFLRKIKCLLSETKLLKERLGEQYGIMNVRVFENFRMHQFKAKIERLNDLDPLKIVFMSRVNKMKGYEMVIYAARHFNNTDIKIKIDFYGPIFEKDKKDFMEGVNQFNNIDYCGVLDPAMINETLSRYDLLAFPTKYYTEGLPGAIVDAYISGIPVIVTEWLYAQEFVDDAKTGHIIPFRNGENVFFEIISQLYYDRVKLSKLKINALEKSKLFSAEHAWKTLNPLIYT